MEALKEEKRLGAADLAQRSGSGSGASGKDGKDGCLIM